MKLEEVMPAFREGKRIRHNDMPSGRSLVRCKTTFTIVPEGEPNPAMDDVVLIDWAGKALTRREDRFMNIWDLINETWEVLDV